MAKLNELIRRATRGEPAPMGLGAKARRPLPSMLLVALAPDQWGTRTRDAAGAGADVLLLLGRPGDKDVREAVAAADGRPCGLLLSDLSPDVLPHLKEAGLDFIVVGPNAPAATLVEEQLAVVLQLREELSEVQLRVLEPWTVDALYVEAGPATIMRLLELRAMSGLARKPLLVQPAPSDRQDDLLALRDAGVALIGVDLKDRNAIESLKKLRQAIDALPRRRPPRREERSEALLPRGTAPTVEEEEEQEEGGHRRPN